MSYDFHLLPPRADGRLREDAEREMDDGAFAALDPKKEALKQRVADALIARDGRLEVLRVGYEANAPSRLRCLELNDASPGSLGIQISLYDDSAFVTAPFWHEGEAARRCFADIWEVLGVICGEAAYAVYDRQLGRALNPGEPIDAALACYAGTMRKINQRAAPGARGAKPWWKFW